MRLSRWLPALIVVAVLGVAGWQVFERYWYYLPGIMASLTDPVGPNRPVTWQPGPQSRRAARARRTSSSSSPTTSATTTSHSPAAASRTARCRRRTSIRSRGRRRVHAGYAGNATCAPSRAAIMTGRYPTRFGFEFTPAPKAFMRLSSHLQRSDAGIRVTYYRRPRGRRSADRCSRGSRRRRSRSRELLRSRGYHTLGLGKWHLGEAPRRCGRKRSGFDEYLGFHAGRVDVPARRTIRAS